MLSPAPQGSKEDLGGLTPPFIQPQSRPWGYKNAPDLAAPETRSAPLLQMFLQMFLQPFTQHMLLVPGSTWTQHGAPGRVGEGGRWSQGRAGR